MQNVCGDCAVIAINDFVDVSTKYRQLFIFYECLVIIIINTQMKELLRAQEICERVLVEFGTANVDRQVILDLAVASLKLSRTREPAKQLDRIVTIIRSVRELSKDSDIADAVRNLKQIRKDVGNRRPNPTITEISNSVLDASEGDYIRVGGHEFLTDAGARTELQTQNIRATLSKQREKKYTPPEYSGSAEGAVQQYKLNGVLELKKREMIDICEQLNEYINKLHGTEEKLPEETDLIPIILNAISEMNRLGVLDNKSLRDVLRAEADLLADPKYRAKALKTMQRDVDVARTYKSARKDRSKLRKSILAALNEALMLAREPLPSARVAKTTPVRISPDLSLEQHYAQLEKYFVDEYQKMEWFQSLEHHLNSIAAHLAQAMQNIELLMSPEHLDTCLLRLKMLYTTLLRVQIIAKKDKVPLARTALEYFSSLPQVLVGGEIVI